MAKVFVTGGTGYIGRPLIERLIGGGHQVTAVVRPQSVGKLPRACGAIAADVLDASTWKSHLTPEHTFVQLVGVAHPSPAKAREFVAHFIYVSVAHPAPVMKAYIEVRAGCEALIRDARLRATILRSWYVLGPGHRWPLALIPFYGLAECIPALAEGAKRLGLVSLDDMVKALEHAIEEPPNDLRILEPAGIRAWARRQTG